MNDEERVTECENDGGHSPRGAADEFHAWVECAQCGVVLEVKDD